MHTLSGTDWFFFQALKNDLLIFTVICQTVPDLWPLIKTCCILDCSSSPVWSFPPAPALFTLIKHTHTHTLIFVCVHMLFLIYSLISCSGARRHQTERRQEALCLMEMSTGNGRKSSARRHKKILRAVFTVSRVQQQRKLLVIERHGLSING